MKDYTKTLTARQYTTINEMVRAGIESNLTDKAIHRTLAERLVKWGIIDSLSDYAQSFPIAYIMSRLTIEKAKHENKPITEYINEYLAFKYKFGMYSGDYGFYGDIIEIICRIIAKGNINLIKYNDIHVAKVGNIDMRLRGKAVEIGHNGKTFTYEHELDRTIVYGVFTQKDQEYSFAVLKVKGLQAFIEYIGKRMYVFSPEQWQDCMMEKMKTVYSRSASMAFKPYCGVCGGAWQVIYNQSKHASFLRMVEGENVPNLYEYLNK